MKVMDAEEFGTKLAESVMNRIMPLKKRIAELEADKAAFRAQIAALADDNRALRADLVALEAKMFGKKEDE